jgi:ATP-dependent DNA ligase
LITCTASNRSNPSPADILAQLQRANDHGYEGLVLRQGDCWIKVKPEETHDVLITGFVEGRGKHLGRLGYVTTAKGAVGTGFTDTEREFLWAEAQAGTLIGQVIEVSCVELTADAKFRHPFFAACVRIKHSHGQLDPVSTLNEKGLLPSSPHNSCSVFQTFKQARK